jgi:hypothetical protein
MPHALDQRRLARIFVRQRFGHREAMREMLGRCASMEQLDQVTGDPIGRVDADDVSHGLLLPAFALFSL